MTTTMRNGIAETTRRAVAFVAWRLITGHESSALYDHTRACRVCYSGSISQTRIAICDQDGCEIRGSGGLGIYTLVNRHGGKPVSLRIDGLHFEGFDYGASRRYEGRLDRDTLRIRVGRDGDEFSYSVEPMPDS